MYDLLLTIVGQQFSWENIVAQIIRAALIGGFAQLMLWLFRIKLGSTMRHIIFWVSVPLFIFVLGAFIRYANPPTEQLVRAPALKGKIDQINIASILYPPQEKRAVGVAITLVVSIRNTGSPSIVEEWSLSFSSGGTSPLKGALHDIPEKLELEGSTGIFTYSKNDALYDKVSTNPIIEGAMQRGILLFIFDGVEKDHIYRPGNKLVLSYKDIREKEYIVEGIVPARGSDKPQYYPGLVKIPPKK